jgi:hypothetical protein
MDIRIYIVNVYYVGTFAPSLGIDFQRDVKEQICFGWLDGIARAVFAEY